jgi:hypothetical protein
MGTLAMARPEFGRFLILTQTEADLRKSAGRTVNIATAVGVVAATACVVLLVVGLLG